MGHFAAIRRAMFLGLVLGAWAGRPALPAEVPVSAPDPDAAWRADQEAGWEALGRGDLAAAESRLRRGVRNGAAVREHRPPQGDRRQQPGLAPGGAGSLQRRPAPWWNGP